MEEARIWEMHASKMHACGRQAYEIAYERGTFMRDIPMRWALWEARLWETRLWDGIFEKHACERRAYEMAAYERHVYRWRCTSVKIIIVEKRLLGKPASPIVFLPAVASDKEDL
jgi:hypothetical protein